ncbi:MAG TPA: hypothetical protein VK797_08810 [Tepidisphaeraceae bacterium]|jgi:hypothetical protein|nr:hypothetical protein [Tepidisphaeraceae bacterium]
MKTQTARIFGIAIGCLLTGWFVASSVGPTSASAQAAPPAASPIGRYQLVLIPVKNASENPPNTVVFDTLTGEVYQFISETKTWYKLGSPSNAK